MATEARLKVKLQVFRGDEIALGPGKADLLDAIAAHGSISAAARAMGMSYRRAWLLVDTMNRCWRSPLVEAVPGGGNARGARLTPLGRQVCEEYRVLQDITGTAAGNRFDQALSSLLSPSGPGQR